MSDPVEARGSTRTPRRWISQNADRAALIAFVAVEVVAVPVLLSWGRGLGFTADDWPLLTMRGAQLHDLFKAHVDHWITLPTIIYRIWWWMFGIRTYVPYQLLIVVFHLGVAALIRVLIRRAGVNSWIATIAATAFVFFGAGVENIVVAFQITFVGSLIFGFTHLILADHHGPISRRDVLGLAAGLAALLCSGVGVITVFAVALATLLRRNWRVALFHAVPLGGIYLLWYALIGRSTRTHLFHSSSLADIAKFALTGITATFGALGHFTGVGLLLGAVLVAGLVCMVRTSGWRVFRGPAAVPLALLCGAFLFFLVTAMGRAGKPVDSLRHLVVLKGPEHARQSRTIHICAAMVLPSIALAADALIRQWRQLSVIVLAILLIGIPGNFVTHPVPAFEANAKITMRRLLIDAYLPIIRQLPHGYRVLPGQAPGVTAGWLAEGARSGRIPRRGNAEPLSVANETIRLVLVPSDDPVDHDCATLPRISQRTFNAGHRIRLKSGSVMLVLVSGDGVHSLGRPMRSPVTFRFLAGPITLRLAAGPAPAVLCG